jgi:nitrogen fixation-related uncharacterized protein
MVRLITMLVLGVVLVLVLLFNLWLNRRQYDDDRSGEYPH